MDDIKVSVIVPIYNVEEYLEECLISLEKQTLKDIEVLMIDDGSTDHSASIAKKFEKRQSNFHYFYKENGGLGNARNYAIPYVKGQYLIFLDSDDVVPEYAYEKMYNLAVKTGNDMIIGNVKRFNSTKEWDSALHKKVFDRDYEHTHILEKPELVYDTTSWNKLFKTSFYKENSFKFPEKILYEDIPVTIPAHFKANSVGVITDVCYLWRTRDGVSKSITQNRTEIKNFTDRIKIMDMVNEFYAKNVTDKTALFMKDYKWLDVDLKLYINQFLDCSDEYREIAVKEITRYVDSANPEAFSSLRNIDQMKYFYIKENKIDRLLDLIQYQKTLFKSLSIKKTLQGYIGDFPMNDIPDKMKNMTKELEFYPPIQSVRNVWFDDVSLNIDCVFYISRLKKQDDFQAKAYLYNDKIHKRVALEIQRCSSKELTSQRGYRFNRHPLRIVKYDYSYCAYKIKIDLSREDIIDMLDSMCFIQIEYSNELISKTFLLGKSDYKSLNLNQYEKFSYGLVSTTLMNDGNLQIRKDAQVQYIDQMCMIDGYLKIDDKTDFSLKSKHKIYTANHFMLNINDIECGIYDVYIQNQKTTLNGIETHQSIGDKTLFIENNNDGYLQVKIYHTPIVVKEIKYLPHQIRICIEYLNALNIHTPNIVLSNHKFNYDLRVNYQNMQNDNKITTVDFIINIDDPDIYNNLAEGSYSVSLQNKYSHVYDLYIPSYGNVHLINLDNRKVRCIIQNNQLLLRVDYEWKAFENTKKKRRIIKKYIYPLLRLLPIKKKCIIFEGWWGAKYHCNPKYLYEYISKNAPDYRCVWFLNDQYIPINGSGIRIRRKSLSYYYYLAIGKYFVNNVNFHDEYEKRNGQIEIQTMHGTPLKTLGLDVPGELDDPEDRERFLRRRARWDYLVVQSDKASKITASCYAYNKEFLRTGYPRNDILFEKNNKEDIQNLKEKLGIPSDKKVIMYAPTWRKRNYFDIHMDLEDMKNRLGNEYVLLLRIHPFAYGGFDKKILNDFVYNFSTYGSVEELYLVSDIVITDYSSVMFDYTILNRPILFYTYDLEEYRDYLRGFNFDFEHEAPGPLVETYSELVETIQNIDNISKEYDNQLQKFRNKFNEYEHGTASKQIFEKVFKK